MVDKATALEEGEIVRVKEFASSAKRESRRIIEEGYKNIQGERVQVKEIKKGNPGSVVVELCDKNLKEKYLESDNLVLSPLDLKRDN